MAANDNKRTRVLPPVRLTPAELEKIIANANDAGSSVSEYVRAKALKASIRRTKASPERAELIKWLGELGRIGSNINQIARALNRGREQQPAIIEKSLNEVGQLADIMHSLLNNGH